MPGFHVSDPSPIASTTIMSHLLWWCLLVVLTLVPASLQSETWEEEEAKDRVEEAKDDYELVWSKEGIWLPGTPSTSTSQRVASSDCNRETHDGIHYYTSPNFGVANYPNNTVCSTAVAHITANTVGATGVLSTPAYGTVDKNVVWCNFRILTNAANRVRIDYLDVSVRDSDRCKRDRVLVDTYGYYRFATYSSYIYCGTRNVTDLPVSNQNSVLISYKATQLPGSSMQLKYTIV
ncbi:hypothetical protein Pmani_014367 [Petrolisthes manimaculis]|uniref:CUB domain-containing protein n=1 Tax=Petrolisthes manimaculis TaxID=1843537 RepID=A0AAE1PVJ9_9EUCA|nr:hypothetical protein Pmani_014367 [Petrolisthes manimaculis]